MGITLPVILKTKKSAIFEVLNSYKKINRQSKIYKSSL